MGAENYQKCLKLWIKCKDITISATEVPKNCEAAASCKKKKNYYTNDMNNLGTFHEFNLELFRMDDVELLFKLQQKRILKPYKDCRVCHQPTKLVQNQGSALCNVK